MPQRKYRLNLKSIERVAFVDKGDNPTADVLIWKRRPEGETKKALSFAEARAKIQAEQETWRHTDILHSVMRSIMEDEEMDATAKIDLMGQSIDEFAEEMKAAMPAMMKHERGDTMSFDPKTLPEDAQAAFAELQKRADAAENAEPKVPESVTKALADLEKRAQDAEARVAKMELEKRTDEYVATAAAFTHLPIKPAEFGIVLRKVADAVTAEEFAEVERVLVAANTMAEAGNLFVEVGAEGGIADGSALAKVNKLAAEIRKANPKLSDAEARAQVYNQNKDLMAEVEAEDRARLTARK